MTLFSFSFTEHLCQGLGRVFWSQELVCLFNLFISTAAAQLHWHRMNPWYTVLLLQKLNVHNMDRRHEEVHTSKCFHSCRGIAQETLQKWERSDCCHITRRHGPGQLSLNHQTSLWHSIKPHWDFKLDAWWEHPASSLWQQFSSTDFGYQKVILADRTAT